MSGARRRPLAGVGFGWKDVAHLPGAGDFHTDMRLICREASHGVVLVDAS